MKVQTRAMLEQKMMPKKNEPFRTIKKTWTYASNSSCKHNSAIAYKNRNPFYFVSDICFLFLYMEELQGKLVHSLCSRLEVSNKPLVFEVDNRTLERCSGVFIVDFV